MNEMEIGTFHMKECLDVNDLQKTIKHGFIFYTIVAMLAIPSALCSPQPRMPVYPTPVASIIGLLQDLSPQCTEIGLQKSGAAALAPATGKIAQEDAGRRAADQPAQDEPPYYAHILQAAQAYHVDPALIQAIIATESSYNPQAVSKRGAKGLMQLMPTTAKALGIKDSFDPARNIDGGVRYLRRLLDRFEGDVRLALAAYNAGSRYVYEYGGVPPFRATKRYIKKVLRYRKKFQNEMADGNSPDPAV